MTDKFSPSHYQGFSNGAQVIDIAERLSYNRGQVVKYCARSGRKHGESALDDLKKARWYIEREIQRIETDGTETPTAIIKAVHRIQDSQRALGLEEEASE